MLAGREIDPEFSAPKGQKLTDLDDESHHGAGKVKLVLRSKVHWRRFV